MEITGIDVSRWQKQMDWAVAEQAGAKFAFIRASFGLQTDINFRLNLITSAQTGIFRSAFHAFRVDLDPVDQAELFWNTVYEVEESYGVGIDLPLVLDVEQNTQYDDYGARLEVCALHLEHISGWKPIIYTRKSLWDPRIGFDGEWAKTYDLWVADYTDQDRSPLIPQTWMNWRIWQYGQVAGPTYGSSASLIDVNRFNGGYLNFRLWALFRKLFRQWRWRSP